jgi:hypothetical protein
MKIINKLLYKKASDINLEYPILEVYDEKEMVIDIEITDSKELKVNIYKHKEDFKLNIDLLRELINKADEFYNNEV